MADLTRRDVIQILATTKRARLVGVDLAGEQLQNLNFDLSDMRQANLEGADCSGASFHRAALAKANMRDAIFDGASINDADLMSADLRNASFRNATFRLVDLQSADLRGADFRGATVHLWPLQIQDAQLEGIITDDETTWVIDPRLDDIPGLPYDESDESTWEDLTPA